MKTLRFIGRLPHWLFVAVFCWLGPTLASNAANLLVTNLAQLHESFAGQAKASCSVSLKGTVCSASRSEVGAVILQDVSGVELLQIDHCPIEFRPGDEIFIEADHCLLRQREAGVEISAIPLVDNDGVHGPVNKDGSVALLAGSHQFQLDWFNGDFAPDLEVTCEGPQMPLQRIPAALLGHGDCRGTNNLPGLSVKLYEGKWTSVPDFNWLAAIKTASVTNIGLDLYPLRDRVGLRFTGLFSAPRDGKYTFHLRSANGALLFVGNSGPLFQVSGREAPPPASAAMAGQIMNRLGEGCWVAVEGRVNFITKTGQGLELELRSGNGLVRVKVADAPGFDPAKLFHARIRVKGVGRSITTFEDNRILGRLLVASASDLEILEAAPNVDFLPPLIATAEQVQLLRPKDAARHLPVRIRGVVTSAFGSLTLQDDTRGVYVDLIGITNKLSIVGGEVWEVTGHTQPGDFAPVIAAEKLEFQGAGQLPSPAHPTLNQLINGSMDIQYVEIQGMVTAVSSNQISLLMPEGILQVWFEAQNQDVLKSAFNSYVTIRGVLFASWDVKTHEVNPRQIFLRNSSININHPAPADVFDVPLKTTRDLLHFDVQAASFQRIKMRGVVIHAEAQQIFLNDENSGLRILPIQIVNLHPGAVVEAVGYPEIGGASPILREAVVRKLGTEPLPAPKKLGSDDLARLGLDATYVQIEAILLNRRMEPAGVVLEMQAGLRPFLARYHGNKTLLPSLRTGSHLQLTGVFASLRPLGRGETERGLESFELLLDSPGAIRILSQPPWWTLKRLLAAVGALSLLLSLVALWVFQLHRQVNLQTNIIREKAEREIKLEERTRIARDLHDDLGASLTEITVLASTGLLRTADLVGKIPDCFQSICDKSRQLVTALDAIVWAIDPQKNTLQSLADYLAGYAGDYLSTTGIACRYKLPVELPQLTLDGKVRHELFLAVKEALHNVVQHSRADAVEFEMTVTENKLEIAVADNGCGFEPATVGSKGHGLNNFSERMTRVGGACVVTARQGGGVSVRLKIPLPTKQENASEAIG